MTSRERVRKALNHESPDRVPIDFGGFQTGIHRNAYRRLIDHMGIRDEVTILDPVQQLARPCEELLRAIPRGYPLRPGSRAGWFRRRRFERVERNGRLWHDLKDEFGVVWSMPADQPLYMDISHHPARLGHARRTWQPIPGRTAPIRRRFTGVRKQRRPFVRKLLTPSSPGSAASCTSIAGTCGAWSGGSWT